MKEGQAYFESLLDKIEHAIDEHETLTRQRRQGSSEIVERAKIEVTRGFFVTDMSWTASIPVRLKNHRKMSEFRESGDTPEEAVDKLIKNRDLWAKAIE